MQHVSACMAIVRYCNYKIRIGRLSAIDQILVIMASLKVSLLALECDGHRLTPLNIEHGSHKPRNVN